MSVISYHIISSYIISSYIISSYIISSYITSYSIKLDIVSYYIPLSLSYFVPLSLSLCSVVSLSQSLSLSLSSLHSLFLFLSLYRPFPPLFFIFSNLLQLICLGRKIDELKILSDPIENRQSEDAQRGKTAYRPKVMIEDLGDVKTDLLISIYLSIYLSISPSLLCFSFLF